MKKTKLSRNEIVSQWLELYPLRKLEYEKDDNGLVVLIVPHSENWFTRKFLPKPKSPAGKVKLDDIGTFVWEHCDGTRTIKAICEAMLEIFGEKINSVEDRTVTFLQTMYGEKFISLFKKEDTSQNTR